MKVEVLMPSPPSDFNFDSTCTTPYINAPSSPTHFSAFYLHFHGGDTLPAVDSISAVSFNWEEKPGILKSQISTATSSNYGDAEENLEEIDFEFDFGGQIQKSSLSADELFDGGKIRPLKPPPKFQYDVNKTVDSPKSPKNLTLSPRNRRRYFDLFTDDLKQSPGESVRENANEINSSKSRNKGKESLTKYRIFDVLLDPEFTQEEPTKYSSSIWYKKWKIKDLLLFKSVSDKDDQLKKYELLKKTREINLKNSSLKPIDSDESASSKKRTAAPISAHELHYTENRAVSEEMKKKTYLPYKKELLGCLGFHSTVPAISKGIGSSGSVSRR